MKSFLRLLVLCLAVSASWSTAMAESNANIIFGERFLGHEFWDPVDHQLSVGVNLDFGKEDWPIHLAVGLQFSFEDKGDWLDVLLVDIATLDGSPDEPEVDGEVLELTFGIVKIWNAGKQMRIFLGGGVASLYARILDGVAGISDDDTSQGVYANAGIYWIADDDIGPQVNFGVEMRILRGTDIRFFGVQGDADSFQIALLAGWGW